MFESDIYELEERLNLPPTEASFQTQLQKRSHMLVAPLGVRRLNIKLQKKEERQVAVTGIASRKKDLIIPLVAFIRKAKQESFAQSSMKIKCVEMLKIKLASTISSLLKS